MACRRSGVRIPVAPLVYKETLRGSNKTLAGGAPPVQMGPWRNWQRTCFANRGFGVRVSVVPRLGRAAFGPQEDPSEGHWQLDASRPALVTRQRRRTQ